MSPEEPRTPPKDHDYGPRTHSPDEFRTHIDGLIKRVVNDIAFHRLSFSNKYLLKTLAEDFKRMWDHHFKKE